MSATVPAEGSGMLEVPEKGSFRGLSDLPLVARQVGFEQLSFWLNPIGALMTIAFSVVFLILLGATAGTSTVSSYGHIKLIDYYVAGFCAYGVMAACFTILAIQLVNRREVGLLKRLRLSPLPTWMAMSAVLLNAMIIAALGVIISPLDFPAWLPVLGELAPVMHQEASRTGELICLARNHPEGQFLVGQVSTWQLQRLGNVVGIYVDRGRRLVKPASLEFLQAVLGQLIVGLARAVVVRCHVGPTPPRSLCALRVTLGAPLLCPIQAGNSVTSRDRAHVSHGSGEPCCAHVRLAGPETAGERPGNQQSTAVERRAAAHPIINFP